MDKSIWFNIGLFISMMGVATFTILINIEKNKLTQVIEGYKNSNIEFLKGQAQTYRETLDKIINREIPMPPDFAAQQEKVLLSSVENIEEWAKSLNSLKGMGKEQIELEYTALKARAEMLEPKLESLVKPVLTLFQEVVSAINKERAFGGDISLKTLNANPVLIIIMNPRNGQTTTLQDEKYSSDDSSKLMEFTLPNGNSLWEISLRPATLYVHSSTADKDQCTKIYIKRFQSNGGSYVIIPRQDNTYETGATFSSEWGKDFLNKTGDKDFLRKFIQKLFEEEIKLYDGK